MSWYSKVSKDISFLPDCIEHFYKELDSARYEVKIHGNVEKASAHLPGIVEQRFNQLQEIEAVLNFLNIQLRKIRRKHFQKYLEGYARALTSREVEATHAAALRLAVHDVGIRLILLRHEAVAATNVVPHSVGDRPLLPPARTAPRSIVLQATAHAVRHAHVGRDVVELA